MYTITYINKIKGGKVKLELNWNLEQVNEYIEKHGRDKKVKQLEQNIIENGNPKEIFLFAVDVKRANVKKLQKAIIQKGEPENILSFATYVKHAKVKQLQKIILEKGDAELCYRFAKDVKVRKIKELQEKVLSEGDSFTIYGFANNVAGADIEKLQEKVIKDGGAFILYLFAKNVKGADVKKLQDAILKTGDIKHINLFAKEVVGADKSIYIDNSENERRAKEEFWKIVENGSKIASNLSYNKDKCFSKIGGYPLVPKNFEWPVDKANNKIPFVMQLDFAELTQEKCIDNFPNKGKLYVFIDNEKVNATQYPTQGEDFQVFYLNAKDNELVEKKTDIKPYKQRYLKSKSIKTYPDLSEYDGLYKLFEDLSDKEKQIYNKKCNNNVGVGLVGGWSQIFQSSFMEKDEVQLIQFDSVGNELVWGDLGIIHLYMNAEDLKNLNFKNIKLYLETS